MNTATCFSSRFEPDTNEKKPKKRDDKIIKCIEVNIGPTGIPEEPVFKTGDDRTKISEEDIWQCNADFRNTICSQLPVITMSSVIHIDLPNEPSIVDTAHFKKLQEY